MKRRKKLLLLLVGLPLLALVLSPWISLLLPAKLRNHAYNHLVYEVIAEVETEDVSGDDDVSLALFDYVRNTVFTPANLVPYDAKPITYLTDGQGYCDNIAWVYATLVSHMGIPARYVYLRDKDGISPHTMAEVYLNGQWRILDPHQGLIFYKDKELATLEDLSNAPPLVLNHAELLKLRDGQEEVYRDRVSWYRRMFPVRCPPDRALPETKRITVFDRVTGVYWDVFGQGFLKLYQDLYLRIQLQSIEGEDRRTLYRARQYNLVYRMDEATALYGELVDSSPVGSASREDAIFFQGLAHMNYGSDLPKGRAMLRKLLDEYPRSRWEHVAERYLENQAHQ